MTKFRANDGAELAFEERGSGKPAFVLIHGWQADRTVWHGLADALGRQRARARPGRSGAAANPRRRPDRIASSDLRRTCAT